jgi:hypothetical protein
MGQTINVHLTYTPASGIHRKSAEKLTEMKLSFFGLSSADISVCVVTCKFAQQNRFFLQYNKHSSFLKPWQPPK